MKPENLRSLDSDRNSDKCILVSIPIQQQSPEHQQHQHILAAANASQQHVYATPSRVQTPDALLSADDLFSDHRSHHYTRPSRSKSRNSTLQQQHHYPTGVRYTPFGTLLSSSLLAFQCLLILSLSLSHSLSL